jgi:hypothetical protein
MFWIFSRLVNASLFRTCHKDIALLRVMISDRKFLVSVSVSAEMSADISVSVSVSAIFKVSVSAEISVHIPAEISVHIPAEISVIEYVKSQNVCTLLILK